MGRIQVRLIPRAKLEAIEGWCGDVLSVRVTAPPVDGRANDALLRLLAKTLAVPLRDVSIVTWATNRDKLVEVSGLDDDEVRLRLS